MLNHERRNTFNLNLRLVLAVALWERVLHQIGCTLKSGLFSGQPQQRVKQYPSNCFSDLLQIANMVTATYWLATVRVLSVFETNVIWRKALFYRFEKTRLKQLKFCEIHPVSDKTVETTHYRLGTFQILVCLLVILNKSVINACMSP